jgi:thiol-disulfide isomerase/thioredoxin
MVASFRFGVLVSACTFALAAAAPVKFSLSDAAGQTRTSGEIKHYQAAVLLFVATECPNSNTYAPVLARLYREYSGRGVLFLSVYSDPADSAGAVQKHDAEYQIPFSALLDPGHTLAVETGARSTPEAVVLSPAGQVLYRGRVDDRFVDFGKTRYRPAHEDLREALDQVLSGQPVKNPATKVLGCAIPGVN